VAGVRNRRRERCGEYGVDGPRAGLFTLGVAWAALAGLALVQARHGHTVASALELAGSLVPLVTLANYLYATRRGKFAVWAELLDGLQLRGDEHVLDMGCGRGAILSLAAELVPQGAVVGLDLWRREDQSGNSPEATRRNLEAEGVRGRCALATADMTAMPFPPATFDVVVSNLAIHNISGRDGRRRAIDEAVRVLKPGGRLLVADLMGTQAYASRLRAREMDAVDRRRFDWRFWYGGPWLAMLPALVTATKPAGSPPPSGADCPSGATVLHR
jgi:SAM-dependent methyltransferase